MPVQLQAPSGFIGGYMAGQAFRKDQEARDLEIEGQKLLNQKERISLAAAEKAVASQANIVEALRNIPNLKDYAAEDPAKALSVLATVLTNEGQVEEAAAILGKAATARKDMEDAAETSFEVASKRAAIVASAMEGVGTAEEWKAAVAGLMTALPGEADKLYQLVEIPNKNPQFDYAKAATGIVAGATTSLQKAQTEQAEAAAERSAASAAESEARANILIPAQAEQARATAAYRRKQGDTLTRDKLANQTDAKNLIGRDFRVDTPELGVLALRVAEDAENIQRSQPALGRTRALQAAYANAKQDGLFAGLSPKGARAGATKDTALELPVSDGKIDPAALVDNKIYRGVGAFANRFYLWDKKSGQFKLMDQPSLREQEDYSISEDEEDLEEEDYE